MALISPYSLPTTSEDISLQKSKGESRNDRANRRSEIKNERTIICSDPSKGKNFTGHWTFDQNTKYLVFLMTYQQSFEKKSLRRSQKIFKEMSKLLKTRTADQCRSHHQKMEKKCLSFERIIQFLENSYPMGIQLRNYLQNECIKLKNQISDGSEFIQKEVEQEIPLQSNISGKDALNPSVKMFQDMSVFRQNEYYVMPVFVIPCSELMFYSIYGKSEEDNLKSNGYDE